MYKSNLENYYPGDDSWRYFAMLFGDEWSACQFQNELLLAVNDEDIAAVIYGSVWQSSLQWIDKPIPALNDRTLCQCIETGNGRKRLKTMLMRMPR